MKKKTIKIKEIKTTIKQKRAFELVKDNKDKLGSMGEVMREAGYSDNTSRTPQNLTETKGWNELMEEHFPDDMLAEVHKGLLKSKRIEHMVFPLATEDATITE